MKTKVYYSVTRGCTSCGTCVFECAQKAITLGENGAVIDRARCVGCGKCADNCASEAIERIEERSGG
jgi:electron transport complex protein RnfB